MFIIFYKSIPAYPPTNVPMSYLGTSKAHWNVGCFEKDVGWAKGGRIAKMAYKDGGIPAQKGGHCVLATNLGES